MPYINTAGSSARSLLARTQYAPASLATYNFTLTTLTAIDTTNITVSFVVPSSLAVLVRATISFDRALATNTAGFGLLNHSGGAQVGVTANSVGSNVLGTENTSVVWLLTGLAPGTLALDLAAGFVTAGTCHCYAQGATGAVSASNAAPAVLEVWSA